MKILKLSYLIPVLILFPFAAFEVKAQTGNYIGAGITGTRTSNSNNSTFDSFGSSFFGGMYAEGGLSLKSIQFKGKVDYSKDETLSTLFTRDLNPEREAKGELGLRAEALYRFNKDQTISPFVGTGIQGLKQFNLTKPNLLINPLLTFGVNIKNRHELSFSRIFTDQTKNGSSRLSGYRGSYSYLYTINEKVSLRFGGELNYYYFRENADTGRDNYFEKDWSGRASFGFIIK
jgi:outer membrane protein with beta-barrel domain